MPIRSAKLEKSFDPVITIFQLENLLASWQYKYKLDEIKCLWKNKIKFVFVLQREIIFA
jgi:hypothetical protein